MGLIKKLLGLEKKQESKEDKKEYSHTLNSMSAKELGDRLGWELELTRERWRRDYNFKPCSREKWDTLDEKFKHPHKTFEDYLYNYYLQFPDVIPETEDERIAKEKVMLDEKNKKFIEDQVNIIEDVSNICVKSRNPKFEIYTTDPDFKGKWKDWKEHLGTITADKISISNEPELVNHSPYNMFFVDNVSKEDVIHTERTTFCALSQKYLSEEEWISATNSSLWKLHKPDGPTSTYEDYVESHQEILGWSDETLEKWKELRATSKNE